MRQLAYALLLTSAGCSLIYNPSNLPAAPVDGNDNVDMAIDAREIIDANAAMPTITSVAPAQLFEGQGTSNGRKAVVVVTGDNFVEGAKIIIALHDQTTQAPGITVDDAATEVSEDHKMVAAPVTLAVDSGFDANEPAERLDVIVTQPSGGSMAMVAFTTLANDKPVLERVGLDELTDATLGGGLAAGLHEFSEVNLTSALTTNTGAVPLQLRVRGGITIDTASVSAIGKPGGPGALNGGNGGGTGVGQTAGGSGGTPGGGVTSGGGGAYGANAPGGNAGTAHGDEEITKLGNPNLGSGGAGGNGSTLTLTPGGDGGGGGGTIELTAGGAISIGTLTADGGDGESNQVNQTGGGGSGGLILLRGANVTVTGGLSVAGGTGTGAGSVGRIRIDSAAAAIPAPTPAAYRGPMLAAASTPLIVRTAFPSVTFLGQPQRAAKYEISNADGSSVRNIVEQNLGNGSNTVMLQQALFEGLNRICLYVDKADTTMAAQRPEARNCIEIVYLFKNP